MAHCYPVDVEMDPLKQNRFADITNIDAEYIFCEYER